VDREVLEQCSELESSGQKLFSITRCRGSQLQTVYFFNARGCKEGPGTEKYVQSYDVDKCIQLADSRGISTRISCNRTAATFMSWSLEPAQPTNVSCDSASAGADTLQVSCHVDASEIDEVSFEVSSPSGRPFLTVTGLVAASGEAKVSIPGLHSNAQYRVFARAHRRGEQEGNPDTWSKLSAQSALCSTAGGGGQQRPPAGRPDAPAVRAGKPKTRWLETYRMVNSYSPGDVLLPDFLDQHNGADLPGLMGMVSMRTTVPEGLPLTRYCVEVLDVQLPDVITASVDGRSQTAPFANFVSCNQGECRCMHQVDRAIAHLPARQILDFCAGNPPADSLNNTCRCPGPSMNDSLRYVGRSPIPLPFFIASSLMSHSDIFPPNYPPSFRPEPMGSFHSFPAGGHCPPGASVGEGSCVWQLSPVAHTVYLDDLIKMGFNISASAMHIHMNETTGELISMEVDYDTTVSNLNVTKRAFAAMRLPPCGEPAAVETGDAIIVV